MPADARTPDCGKPSAQPAYTKAEEIWSASIHGVGILFGFAFAALLITFASLYGDAWTIVGVSIFSACVILLYLASTLYHAVPSPRAKPALKKFDHIAIFFLIAGTYTPFLLSTVRSAGAWVMFGIIWGLTLTGTVLKLCAKPNGAKLWSILLYLTMGWLAVFLLGKLLEAAPLSSIVFLAAGGVCYTVGVVFYVQKKRRYTHAIWHLFVLAGTLLQFFAVLYGCALN